MGIFHSPRSHITDSRFYGRGYSTEESRLVFCDLHRMQRWLDVEAALAKAQAEVGLIPATAAEELVEKARLELLDINEIRDDIVATGHSLIPLLNAWQKAVDPSAAGFIHYGATTQDIQDTAQSLELKDIFSLIFRDLAEIIEELIRFSDQHRDLITIGRTHGQHALPTTLGLKFAIWLDEMLRHLQRLEECQKRTLVSQLFGGVGTMAAFDGKGRRLIEKFSKHLGLGVPTTAWHSARDRIAEFHSTLALVTGTLAKIANEICQLSRNETGELEEPFHMGKIGSSTMPHKRNPEMCEQVVVLARLVKSSAALGFEGLINEHERDYRSVRLEWAALADACSYSCGALHLMKVILEGLIIHPENIRRNLDNSACLISTEALMFLIGNVIGKQAAHTLIYEISMTSYSTGKPLADLLIDHPLIAEHFEPHSIRNAIDPSHHIGEAGPLTDQVTAEARSILSTTMIDAESYRCPLSVDGHCCDSGGLED